MTYKEMLEKALAGTLGIDKRVKIDTKGNAKNAYRVVAVYKLSPQENAGKHNLYIDVIDKLTGRRMKEVPIIWGWEGQRPDQIITPLKLDKPDNEPMGSLPIWANQKIWAEPANRQADEVFNIHTMYLDEGPGNTWGHHSWYVVWLYDTKPETPPELPTPPTPPSPGPGFVPVSEVKKILVEFVRLKDDFSRLADKLAVLTTYEND